MLLACDRRDSPRYSLNDLETVFRQCDLSVSNGRTGCDATLMNISSRGACLRFDEPDVLKNTPVGAELFFHGCVFNNLVGFLSSAKAKIRWIEDDLCGLTFLAPLDMSAEELRLALDADNSYLDDLS